MISIDAIGRYRVVRLAGQGAMGRVLVARDPVLERDVAVKLLRDDLGLPPEVKEALFARMRHEARAAARVSHPNLVTLHDMGDDAALGVYLVFELVDGETLKDAIDRGPVAPALAARVARELGSALTAAHAAGVVHRDVKPDNVILARTGAKITDFGIARVPDSTLTLAGGLIGTPAYCAPEALSGGRFSAASDQFSLAATMYEAASAERAFPGDDAVAVAARIANETPPPFAARLGLPPRVDEVLARGLSRDPAQRFPSCEAFGRALADAMAPASARSATPLPATPADATARGAWVRPAAAGALAGLLGGALLGTAATRTSPWRPDPAPAPVSAAVPATSSPRPPTVPSPTRPRPAPVSATAPSGSHAAPADGSAEAAADGAAAPEAGTDAP